MIAGWILLLPWNIISEFSYKYGIDKNIVAAIIQKESNGRICATRYERNYKWILDPEIFSESNYITLETEIIAQKTSYGLMQLMGAVAREYGFQEELINLCNPRINIDYGCRHLKSYLDKYDTIDEAIASYNAGSPRIKNGKFVNQRYVDEVNFYIAQIKGDKND